MNWLNYHHLQYFWMAAREGSLTKAASQMHVTPATLSIQIRELEKAMKVKLLRKEGRSVVLTDAGRLVLEYANDIFTTGRELMEMVQDGGSASSRLQFRVGVKDVMPKLVAYRFLESVLSGPPKIKLVCSEGSFENLVADLSIHRLDLVLSDTPLHPSMRVRAYSHLLGQSPVEWMGSKQLIKDLKKGYPKSLLDAPYILPMENTALRCALDQWFYERGFRPEIRGEFEDSAMLKIAGKLGAGILPVPTMIADKVSAMYQLESLGVIDGIIERFYAISVDRKLKHPAAVAISKRYSP